MPSGRDSRAPPVRTGSAPKSHASETRRPRGRPRTKKTNENTKEKKTAQERQEEGEDISSSDYSISEDEQKAEDEELDKDMETDSEDERQNELDMLAKEAEMDLDEVIKGYKQKASPDKDKTSDKGGKQSVGSMPTEDNEQEEEDTDPDASDSSDSGSESSFDEFSVGIALEMPKRQNRSKKYTTLVGEELEKDQQFWEHSTWNEEQEDDDYVCSEGESFYEYETDSDFDVSESSEEEVVVEKVERKKRFKAKSYIDPALLRYKKLHAAPKAQSEAKKSKTTTPIETNIMFRSKRDTTIKKTEEVIAKNERDKVNSQISNKKMPTQEEFLKEAERVEAMNKESLEALLASEIEKKRYTKYTRQNWNSLVSIINEDVKEPIVERELEMYFFTDGKIPGIYEQEVDLEPKTILCPITGNKAKYIDPLTKVPFDSIESFNRIREIAERDALREEQESLSPNMI